MNTQQIIALQLYSVRAVGDFPARLALAKACGYSHVETEVTYGLSAEEFSVELQEHGIKLASMHVEMQDLRLRMPLLLDALKRCACTNLVMPWLEEDERPQDLAGWLALARELNQFAQSLAQQGIQLAYHNHAFEFDRLNNAQTILSFLFEHAPQLKWQADVAWVYRAGEDGQAWLDCYRERLCSVHVKDLAVTGSNPTENDWANLGEGRIAWPDILCSLQNQVHCYIVEHDQPNDAKNMAQIGYAYLQKHLG
jgi:sugar phosphate isomerase/epimerase